MERLGVEVAAGRKRRVLISVPPRHGKSDFWSKFFVAWFLGIFPDKRVILCAYESDFAAQWGQKVRDLLVEHGPTIFGVSVRQDSSARNRWEIEGRQGGMQTAGAGGPIMGKGADLLIVDDPHKNWEEVFSEKIREGVWEWFQSTARSRLEPNASVVVLQQRWHETDLLGRLLELDAKGLEKWERIDFPALAEDRDVLGRKRGEALWPERFDEKALNDHRVTIHSKFWDAQYQQHPSPLEGGLFKREHETRYSFDGVIYALDDGSMVSLNELQCFVTVDTAASTKSSADKSAIAAWGMDPRGRLLLLDLDMRRVEVVTLMQAIRDMSERYGAIPWIEDNATSKHLLQLLESQGFMFRTVLPGSQDKFTRAYLHAGMLWEKRRIVIPDSTAGWDRDFVEAFRRQVYRFAPESDEDDAVDCFVRGTMIRTPSGERSIESVADGDLVETRFGPRRVRLAASTGVHAVLRVEVEDGSSIEGTPNHPLWVIGRGWTRIDELTYGDRIGQWLGSEEVDQSPCSSTGSNSGDTQTPSLLRTETTSGQAVTTPSEESRRSTSRSGSENTGEPSRAGITSTTRTKTRSTTIPAISSAFRDPAISACTDSSEDARRPCEPTSTSRDLSPPSGIRLRLEGSGTAKTVAGRGGDENQRLVFASSADARLRLGGAGRYDSVLASALLESAEQAVRTTRTGPVASVAVRSRPTATPRPGRALQSARVLRVVPVGRTEVFNLSVEGDPEFFANGMLAHNCMSYAARVAVEELGANSIGLVALPAARKSASALDGYLSRGRPDFLG